MFNKVKEAVKKYMRWGNTRLFIIRCSFLLITICASILGYITFGEFGYLFGLIIFAALITYDLVIAPGFPNVVHYMNRIASTGFSIALMIFVGISGGMFMVMNKADPTLAVIDQKIAFEQSINKNETESTSGVGFAMTGDNSTLKASKGEAKKARENARDLLNQKQDYIENQGGKYMDPTIVIYKVIADWYNKIAEPKDEITPDQVTTIVMIITWIAIISIQTVLSAEVHGIRVYRPSILGGIKLLLLYFIDIRKTYIDGWKGGTIDYTKPSTTEPKKKEPDDSEIAELLLFPENDSESEEKPFRKPKGKHTKNRDSIRQYATGYYQKHGKYPKYKEIQTACNVGPNTVAEVMKDLKSSTA